MSYGISIITNANDEVLIDGSNLPLVITATGTVNNVLDNGRGTYSIPRPTSLTTPMLFIKWPIGAKFTNMGVFSDTYNIISPDNSGPSSLEYWLCSHQQVTSQGGYGIEIYDDAGQINFTSAESYMRIKEILKPVSTNLTYSQTHPSVPDNYPFTVPLPLPIREHDGNSNLAIWYTTTAKRVSTTQFNIEKGHGLGATPVTSHPDFYFTLGHSPTTLIGQVV